MSDPQRRTETLREEFGKSANWLGMEGIAARDFKMVDLTVIHGIVCDET